MTITRPFLFFAFLLPLLACLSWAALADETVARGPDVTVLNVVSGDGFQTTEKLAVRLAGIYVPPPMSGAAQRWLQQTITGQRLSLWHDAGANDDARPPLDRYGRLLAYARMPDGAYVQGRMLALGLALVMTDKGSRKMADAWLADETAARAGKKGLWADGAFRIMRADAPGLIPRGRFVIVEGIVLQAAQKKDRLYLNFGNDWKNDFSASLTPETFRALAADGKTVDQWQGASVRVRGWTESINGPLITVTHPEQIELLPPRR